MGLPKHAPPLAPSFEQSMPLLGHAIRKEVDPHSCTTPIAGIYLLENQAGAATRHAQGGGSVPGPLGGPSGSSPGGFPFPQIWGNGLPGGKGAPGRGPASSGNRGFCSPAFCCHLQQAPAEPSREFGLVDARSFCGKGIIVKGKQRN